MPLQSLGDGCYRWGDSGKKYCGPGAREKAIKQGRAIEMSKHAKGELTEEELQALEDHFKFLEIFDESM